MTLESRDDCIRKPNALHEVHDPLADLMNPENSFGDVSVLPKLTTDQTKSCADMPSISLVNTRRRRLGDLSTCWTMHPDPVVRSALAWT